jgi:hypothetical protein
MVIQSVWSSTSARCFYYPAEGVRCVRVEWSGRHSQGSDSSVAARYPSGIAESIRAAWSTENRAWRGIGR